MHLLIVAAGSGRRMGADCNKLLLPVLDRPVLAWTFDAVFAAKSISWVGVVGNPVDKQWIIELIQGAPKDVKWIEGGKTRQESVKNGLAGLPLDAKHVLVHDGARCLVKSEIFDLCAEAVLEGQSVIAATPVTDTIKRVDKKNLIFETPERDKLWAAQTPQGFSVNKLREAHFIAEQESWNVTDDASLFERLNWPVKVLDAGPSNIKVTTPFDLTIAEALLSSRSEI